MILDISEGFAKWLVYSLFGLLAIAMLFFTSPWFENFDDWINNRNKKNKS